MKPHKLLRVTGMILFLLTSKLGAQDLGITTMTSPVSGCNLSCTTDLIVTIYNYGPFIVSSNFDISYTVNGGTTHTESIFTTITAGGVYTYNFLVDPVLCAHGTYTIVTDVELVGDINPANNSFTAIVVNDTTVVPGTLVPASDTVCGSANSGVVQLTGYTGYIGTWEYSTNSGSSWTALPDTTDSHSFINLDTTTVFHVLIDGGYCPDGVSPWSVIHVDEPSNGGFLVGTATVCSTGNTGTINLTGYSGNILNWESSTDGGSTFTPIANTTTSETYNNLTQTTIYQAVTQNGVCPSAISAPVTITVDSPGSAGSVASDATVCYGSTGSVALLGYSGSISYWLASTDGGATWSPIANTTASQTYTGLTQTTTYTAIVQNGVCPADTSTSATITIVPLPTPYAGPDDTLIVNDTLCFTAATGGFFYQWTPSIFLSDPNIQSPCMIPDSAGVFTYTLTVQDAAGCTGTDMVTIYVIDTSTTPPPPTPVDSTVALVVCNFVTPNNDGDNDVWNIIGIDQYPDNNVKVINNHGQIVFEQSAYNNTWKGDSLPDGSYYYLVKVPALDKTYKGVLTITSSR